MLNYTITSTAGGTALATPQTTEAVAERVRHFEAAGHGARTQKWHRTGRGPAADMTGLARLRYFSRDMVRNNPYAQRAINLVAKNTVGTGIVPTFKGSKSKLVKKRWQGWAGTRTCDFNSLLNFYGIQEQVMRAVAESGDAIIIRRWNMDSPTGFDLQVLESDFLDENMTRAEQDGGFSMQGVVFDSNGRRKGYYLFDKHPGEIGFTQGNLSSRYVPASEVVHVFEVLRPGQVRGIPMGVSAFIRLKDFDEFQDAQLYKQKIAALFVMVVTDTQKPLGKQLGAGYDPLDKMVPGIVEHLPYGKDVKFSQPPTTEGTDEYSKTVLRAIAVAYNVTYEALTNDYSNVNFSSGRMGWLEFARNVASWQDRLMITMLCDGVFEWFQQSLKILGGFSDNLDITWTTPRREMIDPFKEGKAMIELVSAGVISRQEFQRLMGYDPDDVNAEIAADLAVDASLGAEFTTSVKYREPKTPAASGAKALPASKKKAVSKK